MKRTLLSLALMAAAGVDGVDSGSGAAGAGGTEGANACAAAEGAASVQTSAPAPATRAKQVKVRVLAHCAHGVPNQVVSLPGDVAKLAQKDGTVDPEPAAVAYAESLAKAAE